MLNKKRGKENYGSCNIGTERIRQIDREENEMLNQLKLSGKKKKEKHKNQAVKIFCLCQKMLKQ